MENHNININQGQETSPFYLRKLDGFSDKHVLLRVGNTDIESVSIVALNEDGRIVSVDLEEGPLLYRGYDMGDGRIVDDIEEISGMFVITLS